MGGRLGLHKRVRVSVMRDCCTLRYCLVHPQDEYSRNHHIGCTLQTEDPLGGDGFREREGSQSIPGIEPYGGGAASPLDVLVKEHHVGLASISGQDNLERVGYLLLCVR